MSHLKGHFRWQQKDLECHNKKYCILIDLTWKYIYKIWLADNLKFKIQRTYNHGQDCQTNIDSNKGKKKKIEVHIYMEFNFFFFLPLIRV
jgi:hypothetical protein